MLKTLPPVLHFLGPGRFPGIHFEANDDKGGTPPPDDDNEESDEEDEDDEEDADDDKSKEKGSKKDAGISLNSKQLKEKLNRARGTERKALLEKYGVKDEAELESKLKKLKEFEDKDKSEADKAKDDAKEAQKRADDAVKNAEKAVETAFTLKLGRFADKAGVDEEEFEDFVLPKMKKFIKDQDLDNEDLSRDDFDEFFASLKKKHPGLFSTKEKDANTGPKDKKPKDKTPDNPNKPPKPVSEMNAQEYAAYKRSKGWG